MIEESHGNTSVVAGVDEVGRGALFGPVVAAAVVVSMTDFPQLCQIGVKDSKQLSARRREVLVPSIQAIAYCCQIGVASVEEIDQLNILQASLLAMQRAVRQLSILPACCYVDGHQAIPDLGIPQKTLVGGDRRSPVIAAASIVAKVQRDALIIDMAKQYPGYDLAANKGYGTARHREALQQYGPTNQHRLSFAPCHSSNSHTN